MKEMIARCLEEAVRWDRRGILRFLLVDRKISIDFIADPYDIFPLWYAQRLSTVQYLVETYGASLEPLENGVTIETHFTEIGKPEIAEWIRARRSEDS